MLILIWRSTFGRSTRASRSFTSKRGPARIRRWSTARRTSTALCSTSTTTFRANSTKSKRTRLSCSRKWNQIKQKCVKCGIYNFLKKGARVFLVERPEWPFQRQSARQKRPDWVSISIRTSPTLWRAQWLTWLVTISAWVTTTIAKSATAATGTAASCLRRSLASTVSSPTNSPSAVSLITSTLFVKATASASSTNPIR